MPDTPANRKLFIDIASDDKNFLVTDQHKNQWFAKTLDNGKQVWVRARDGIITDAGLNEIPQVVDPIT